jgi:drug/metabolite transporter (DMT)-like permease
LNLESNKKGYAFAILAAAFFGSVSTLAKPSLESINPTLLTCMVYLISAAAITPATLHKSMSFRRKDLLLILGVTISGAVIAPLMYFHGLQITTASNTAVLSNMETVFTVAIAILFFKEKLNKIGYIGLVMVTLGGVIVITDLRLSNFGIQLDAGNLLIIGSSLFWALDNNISKIITKRISVLKIAQLKSVIGGGLLLAVAMVTNVPILIKITEIPFILLLGTVGFAASLYCFLRALKIIGIVKTIVIFATSSVFGLIFAVLFLHEEVSIYQIGAIIVMISGVYLINRKGEIEPTLVPPEY